MQLITTEKVDFKKVEDLLNRENNFINNLFSILPVPNRKEETDEESEEDNEDNTVQRKKPKLKDVNRATSLTELQDRLQAITSKKKLSYKEKLTKKGIKNRIKKKNKQDERNAQLKQIRAEKIQLKNGDINGEPKTAKPVFNSEGKMVFSKFDFTNLGVEKKKKEKKDPKKLLIDLTKQKEKIEELRKEGEVSKAVEIKEKIAWKNALAKAEGEKVKDDPILLKKTVQRKEQKKRSSKKKWEARQENVQKSMEERQKKRQENIAKRKKDKKMNKLKKAAKRGKIIPGF